MKRGSGKKCRRYFEIRKYAFFNIGNWDKQKNCATYFENRKCAFLIFENGIRKKIWPGF